VPLPDAHARFCILQKKLARLHADLSRRSGHGSSVTPYVPRAWLQNGDTTDLLTRVDVSGMEGQKLVEEVAKAARMSEARAALLLLLFAAAAQWSAVHVFCH
jgi:hypothetical protein